MHARVEHGQAARGGLQGAGDVRAVGVLGLALPDLTTTVLTMTLTGIGADLRAGRRRQVTLARRLLVVITMLAGGIGGAALVLHAGVVVPLAVATGLLALTAIGAALAARRESEWRHPARVS